MRKRCVFSFLILSFSLLLLAFYSRTWAACDGSDMSTGSYCVYQGGFGIVGGDRAGTTYSLTSSNMYPYHSDVDLGYWYAKANEYYIEGNAFREALLLIDVTPELSTPQGRMLLNPKLNYETEGLLANLAHFEMKLIAARNTYAYDVSIGYPYDHPEEAQIKLLNSVKALSNIYLMIADEFFIDALEYRFSSDTIGIDQKLDEQIALLEKAQLYFEKAVNSFLYGFRPAEGTNIYISDYFDNTVFSLFNLSVERLSMSLREKSSRQFVRLMSPDVNQDWSAARQAALETLKEINTTAYLTGTAIAKQQGVSFDYYGGDNIADALNSLRKQGNIYNNNLNPLGYDNRYIPMIDYEALYLVANSWLDYAETAKTANDAEARNFDSNYEALMNQVSSLNLHYTERLFGLTGCTPPPSNALPGSPAVENFLTCAGEAGGDLFDCRLNLTARAFDQCVDSMATKGSLAMKYRNLMEAQIRLSQARLNRQNILEKINLENEKNNKVIALKRKELGQELVLLDEYYRKLKNARTETDTVTITSHRKRDDGDWGDSDKTRDHTTTETFYIKDEKLKFETDKEKDLRKLTTEFEIKFVNLDTAYTIKNMLLAEAEAEIEIQLAANQKNSAIADFDHAFSEKENLWFLYQKGLEQIRYYTERVPTLRVLKSQAAIDLSEALNYTSHYAYLAAKALEYKYLNPLVDEPVGAGRLRLTDLFKCQTPSDILTFLLKLNSLNTLECPWGTFDPQYHTISLAYNILGLTDGYLDPDGDGYTNTGKTVSDARKEAVQAFISQNINSEGKLQFAFTLSEDDSYLANSGLYNLKIWNGPAPQSCDTLVSEVKGVSVSIVTSQTSNLRPKMSIKQKGHSSLRNMYGEILEYIPVSDYHFLFEGSGDYIPEKQGEVVTFINVDPRYQTGAGSWTGAFKGRGIASSEWELIVFDWNPMYAATDLSKMRDIWIHIDTIGECCY